MKKNKEQQEIYRHLNIVCPDVAYFFQIDIDSLISQGLEGEDSLSDKRKQFIEKMQADILKKEKAIDRAKALLTKGEMFILNRMDTLSLF